MPYKKRAPTAPFFLHSLASERSATAVIPAKASASALPAYAYAEFYNPVAVTVAVTVNVSDPPEGKVEITIPLP